LSKPADFVGGTTYMHSEKRHGAKNNYMFTFTVQYRVESDFSVSQNTKKGEKREEKRLL
jgi:hypothetical protein